MQKFEYDIENRLCGKRLDIFLSEAQSEFSRSCLKNLILEGHVKVNGTHAKPHYRLKNGDEVFMTVPDPEPLEIFPESIPLNVIYEDGDLLVIDKLPGMVVHPAPGHSSGTLVNALLYHCHDLPGINGVDRPGIVHRLDKETSGLIVVAKTDRSLRSLANQFEERIVHKQYYALARGVFQKDQGKIDSPIGRHKLDRKKMSTNFNGRKAVTEYEVCRRYEGFTYLRLFPKTGRTHQIRVHLASIGHPVLGDKLYGGTKIKSNQPQFPRHALHSHQLKFNHPATNERVSFESPLPLDFITALNMAGVER